MFQVVFLFLFLAVVMTVTMPADSNLRRYAVEWCFFVALLAAGIYATHAFLTALQGFR